MHPASRSDAAERRDGYVRRKPEDGVLYRAVQEHWPAVREQAEEQGGLPRFVVREFEEYLRCGVLSEGCLHLVCRSCGYSHLGVLVRYADDFVIVCKNQRALDEAERRVREILTRLGLELHPEKTRKLDLSWGKDGFDFLGCHLRKRLSGPILEEKGRRLYFLQRWPSQRSMKRVRQRVPTSVDTITTP
jgi:hypothetical protein